MQMLLHTRAVVVRRRPFGQHSYILSLLTPVQGLVQVRYFRGKILMPALAQPPQSLNAVIYYNQFRRLSTLKEATLLDGFYRMYQNTRSLVMALTIAEIAEIFYTTFKMDEEAFYRVLDALRYIENMQNPSKAVIHWCVVRLMRSAGIFPYRAEIIEPSLGTIIDMLAQMDICDCVSAHGLESVSGRLWRALTDFCLKAGVDLKNLKSLATARDILSKPKAS